MNKDKYTLNHIIGAYVDGSDYPTKDDVLYSLEKWFWYEGGKAFIEDRNIEHNEYACFADSNIEEIFEKSKYVKKAKSIIVDLISDGIVSHIKETKHTTYYKLNIETK